MHTTAVPRRRAARRHTVQLMRLTAAATTLLIAAAPAAFAENRDTATPCTSVDVTRTVGMNDSRPQVDLYATCTTHATKVKIRVSAGSQRTGWFTLNPPSPTVTVWHRLRIDRHDLRTITARRTFTVHVTSRHPSGRWTRQQAVCRPDGCRIR